MRTHFTNPSPAPSLPRPSASVRHRGARLGGRLAVAVGDLRRVQPVAQQRLRRAQQLPRERDHLRVGAAAALTRRRAVVARARELVGACRLLVL